MDFHPSNAPMVSNLHSSLPRRKKYPAHLSGPSSSATVEPGPKHELPCCVLLTATLPKPTDIAPQLLPTRSAKYGCPVTFLFGKLAPRFIGCF